MIIGTHKLDIKKKSTRKYLKTIDFFVCDTLAEMKTINKMTQSQIDHYFAKFRKFYECYYEVNKFKYRRINETV